MECHSDEKSKINKYEHEQDSFKKEQHTGTVSSWICANLDCASGKISFKEYQFKWDVKDRVWTALTHISETEFSHPENV